MLQGTLVGTINRGRLGEVPLVLVPVKMPRIRNNGFNCFHGIPAVEVPGLFDALADSPDNYPSSPKARAGHLTLRFADGEEFGTFCSLWDGACTFTPR